MSLLFPVLRHFLWLTSLISQTFTRFTTPSHHFLELHKIIQKSALLKHYSHPKSILLCQNQISQHYKEDNCLEIKHEQVEQHWVCLGGGRVLFAYFLNLRRYSNLVVKLNAGTVMDVLTSSMRDPNNL